MERSSVRVEYFRAAWHTTRERVDAFLEQCTCMNQEDREVLSVLLDELGDPEGIRFYCKKQKDYRPPPKRTGKTIDVSGRYDESRDVEYLGEAYEMDNGTWRCLANFRGMLCIVQVEITVEGDGNGT